MKNPNRRQFLTSAAVGGLAAANLPFVSYGADKKRTLLEDEIQARYEKLDQVRRQPIFKKALFSTPVIIESVDLLEHDNIYICRVRSKDGAEGISVAHASMNMFAAIFLRSARGFFIGQDARDLDLIVERFYDYQANYRMNGQPINVPLSAIEFAVLDMMGKIAQQSAAQLIGEIHNPEVGVYVATEHRGAPLEEHFERIKEEVGEYDVNAVKIRVGYMIGSKDLHYGGVPGKAEKLIPMVREHYGDDWSLYADANSYYGVEDAIRIGRLLEEYNYAFYEEPVRYYHIEEIKKVADTLTIPIANGEQDQNLYNMRWLLAHEGVDVVEPDMYYIGGFIRAMRMALMGHAMGKLCVTHMSEGGLGFLYNALFVSALPNPNPHTEFKSFRTNVPFECPTAEMKVVNGKMKAPSGPGMGVVLDPDFMRKLKAVTL